MNKPAVILMLLLAAVLAFAVACQRATETEFSVDRLSCNGCGECVRICPNDAVYLDHLGKAAIDLSKCTKCGNCVAACPNSAIY